MTAQWKFTRNVNFTPGPAWIHPSSVPTRRVSMSLSLPTQGLPLAGAFGVPFGARAAPREPAGKPARAGAGVSFGE